MSGETHPARSPEFLSRLHDGELDPAERARFEAHRAHCAECRDAAAQMEKALAFFRSARPNAAAPDLSARILRRLRNAAPRRRLFGQVFGIDLRWAGAFAAALLAVIVGSSIVVERENRSRRILSESAVPVVIHERTAAALAEPKDRESPVLPKDRLSAAKKKAAAPPEPELRRADVQAARKPPEARNRPQAPAAPSAADESLTSAAPPVARQAPSARSAEQARPMAVEKTAPLEERNAASFQQQRFEPQGGEGGQQAAGALAPQAVQKVRLRVIAPGEHGSTPEPFNAVELSFSPADRGEYTVIVRSDGTVASVRPIESKRESPAGDDARRHAPDELLKLRFSATGQPRHLVVRIE